MLGSKKSTLSATGRTTLISRDTVVVGDIQFSGTLDIEGLVQGNIIALPGKDSLVRVVEKGRVEGELRAPSVIINGVVDGNVYSSKRLELAAKARVQGNVFYTLVEMAAGSEVNGGLSHMVDDEAAADKSSGPGHGSSSSSGSEGVVNMEQAPPLAAVGAKLD